MKWKLLSAFLAVASMVAISNFIGILTIQNLQENFEKAIRENTQITATLRDLKEEAREFRFHLFYTLFKISEKSAAAKKRLKESLRKDLTNRLNRWKKTALGLKSTSDIDHFHLIGHFEKIHLQSYHFLQSSPGKRKEIRPRLERNFQSLLAQIESYLEREKKRTSYHRPGSQLSALRSILIHSLTMIVVVLFAVFLGIVVSSRLTAPLENLKEAAREVENGNFEVQVEVPSHDELGVLGRAFNEMVDNLKATTVSRDYVEQILDTMLSVLLVIDKEGKIEKANPMAQKVLGYSREELLGKDWREITDISRVHQRSELSLPHGEYRHQELEMVDKEGHHLPFLFSLSPLKTRNGLSKSTLWVGQDIRERKKLEREILAISEREQRRIGQDLHDELGQMLTGTALLAKNLEKRLSSQREEESLLAAELVALINEAISLSRNLARGLYPVEAESGNLTEALRTLVHRARELFDLTCQLEVKEEMKIDDVDAITHLYRIAQEAIHNASRHGKATEVKIGLERSENHLELSIVDNGRGFDPSRVKKKGMGLHIMNYRASVIGATLEIDSQKNKGTKIKCIWPLP